MIDPTRPPDVAQYDDLVRRLERLERTVRLANLGLQADIVTTLETCTATSYDNLATVGPTVTMLAPPSGRLFVLATAQTQIALQPGAGVNFGQALLAVKITGDSSFTPVVGTAGHDSAAYVQRDDTAPELIIDLPVVHAREMEGLEGTITLTCVYAKASDEPAATIMRFYNRSLVVLPI